MNDRQSEHGGLAARVLRHIQSPDYRPVKPKGIAKRLKLSGDQRQQLKKVIKQLVKKGHIRYGTNHLVKPAAGGHDTSVTGVFRRTSSGFGFVTPIGTDATRGRAADIYIPSRKSLDASSGDVVQVQLRKPRADGRKRGVVIKVLERETHQFVGLYFERGGVGLVQVDGKLFTQPIPVGDPGAKNAASGDKVVIEMVHFPSHMHEGEAVIAEVLGARGAPGVDTLSIMREFNLPERFPQQCLEAARAEAERFDESVGPERVDLTALTIVTIDPKDARDFDDAISLEQQTDGHWRLGVHIADVGHFVQRNSPLDQEARKRGTSVYLPDRVIPMLPEIISNNLASLQPGRVRYARSVFIEFTAEGVPLATQAQRSAIRSKRRFTYEEVDQFLANRGAWKKKLAAEVFDLLDAMHRLAMILRRRRLDGGAIELSLDEIKLELDRDGRVCGAYTVAHTESHQIIEEFMLAANQAVARMLDDRQLEFLRRIHASPDPRKLRALTEFVRQLGIRCESLESRFEIKRVIEKVAGRADQQAINLAVLRSMQKAVYSPESVGHYALNSDHYCHFTSPIRRYPDLTVHRLLDYFDRGETPPDHRERLLLLGEHCSEREQRAEAAERELVKVKLLHFLSERIGSSMQAVITGVEEYGLFAQGVELPAEGLIHVNSLQDDIYKYDEATRSLIGHREGHQFRLGDLVQVEIAHVDVDRRELDFRLLRTLGRQAPSRSTGNAGKPAKTGRKKGARRQPSKSRGKRRK